MTGPRDIIRQAAEQRARSEQRQERRIPAPAPMEGLTGMQPSEPQKQLAQWRQPPLMPGQAMYDRMADTKKTNAGETEDDGAKLRPVPRNIGGHAIYRELMRSHDRMATRHIDPRG